MDGERKQAKVQYTEHMNSYATTMFGRPMEKLNVSKWVITYYLINLLTAYYRRWIFIGAWSQGKPKRSFVYHITRWSFSLKFLSANTIGSNFQWISYKELELATKCFLWLLRSPHEWEKIRFFNLRIKIWSWGGRYFG